jgi:pimeloyl-ACP methyl ester carboxylesterase
MIDFLQRSAAEPPLSSRLVRVAILLLVAAVAGAARAAGPPRLVDSRPCAAAASFTCSTLRVPLDHTGRARGSLDLAVAVRGDPGDPVLVVLTGGPGQPGVPFAGRLEERFAGVLDRYRLVLIDQRGTGAGALRCPALQAVMGSSDLTVPPPSAVRSCGASLGAKRRFFTTSDTVADLDLLRRALGVGKVAIDGISYGTYVAERYALANPRNVDRLVLDSVVPHVDLDPLVLTSLQATARVLRNTCREHRCGTDPAADLAAVVAKRHDGPRLLDALVTLSIAAPDFPGVPEALRAAREGRPAQLDEILAAVARGNKTPAELLSQGLHAATLCGDLKGPWGGAQTAPATRRKALARAVARLRLGQVWPFDRATAGGTGIVRTCLDWPATPVRPPTVPAKLPRVPVLLLAGDRDLSTPLAWAREEARRAPLGRLVVVHGAGHSVQSRAARPEGREAVRKFLLGR